MMDDVELVAVAVTVAVAHSTLQNAALLGPFMRHRN